MLRNTVARWVVLLLSSTACAMPKASEPERPASGQENISFISVSVDDDTAKADKRLRNFLEREVAKASGPGASQHPVRFPPQTMPYGAVIRAFVERPPDRAYLARITPYAYVAAEMLGAKLDILATYKSVATEETIYRSYFVVPKAQFYEQTPRARGGAATLEDLRHYLVALKKKPAKFIYHDRFSTSSYFLPSLYFRTHHVFAMNQAIESDLIPIQVERLASSSSTDLVERVANGQADLAAVWDGTKKKFEDAAHDDPGSARAQLSDKVAFIAIPTSLPNDFLVASGMTPETRQRILDGVRANPSAGRACRDVDGSRVCPGDDFDSWYAWEGNDSEADQAREALARLRQDARQRPMPVVVKVEARAKAGVSKQEAEALTSYVDAAKEAVRLSGTEFVLEDTDLHKRVDMTWTLEMIHDGALKLTSTLDPQFGPSADSFPISFADRNDLPKRIADLARSRLRRIRYVWPYEEKYPAVLRDLDFTPDHEVMVQRISWMDPDRNEYEEDTPFRARIENNTDFSKLRLSDEIKFSRRSDVDGSFNFEPMSNVAYRVIISREPHAGWIWVALPYCFIALFVAACLGFVVDLRRRQPPPLGLQQTYQRMVDDYHGTWRTHEIEEAQLLWFDAKYVDEFVKELKSAGSFLDVVRAGGFDFNFGPIPIRLSILMKLFSQLRSRRAQMASQLIESSAGGSVNVIGTLIQFLLVRSRLSPFVGFPEPCADASRAPAWPMEWEALNGIAAGHFRRLGICQKPVDASLSADDAGLSAVVAGHFRGVMKRGTHDASLFCQVWSVGESGAPARLFREGALRSAIPLAGEGGLASRVRVEVTLPPEVVLGRGSDRTRLRAWVFGKIYTWSVDQDTLLLHIKPFAILRDHAHQQ